MSAWQSDRLLEGFEALEQRFADDYDGEVVATLVRLPVPAGRTAARGAVLYVHGFIDYFFQRHMAEHFAAAGYAFYAVLAVTLMAILGPGLATATAPLADAVKAAGPSNWGADVWSKRFCCCC